MTVTCRNCEHAADCPQSGDPWGQSHGGWCRYVEQYVNQDNVTGHISPIVKVIENIRPQERPEAQIDELVMNEIMSISHEKADSIAKKYSISRRKVYHIRKKFLKGIRERVKRDYLT